MLLPMAGLEAERLLWSKVAQEGSLDKTKSSMLLEALGYRASSNYSSGCLISENSITIEEYLEAFCADDSEIQDLLSEDLADRRRNPDRGSRNSQNSLIRTWTVSFDEIRKREPRAAEILSHGCFFSV